MPAPGLEIRIQRGTETVEETAHRYGIGRGIAYELARRGELPGVIRLGRRLVVAKAVTDRILGEGASD
ncbi:MAG: helix-turn-helix domain-containing protein [Candidatus Dormiibacterota bacterium]